VLRHFLVFWPFSFGKGKRLVVPINNVEHPIKVRGVGMERKWAITALRGRKNLIGSGYVVQAVKDGISEHWAAATLEAEAGGAVARRIGPGWRLTLTDRRLSGRLSALKMRPNTVQKL
jgi:hypothetical protein